MQSGTDPFQGASGGGGAPEQLAEKLNPGSRLRATVLGGGQTVLKAVGSIPGIRKVEIESEADGQVTFTAESAELLTAARGVPRPFAGRMHGAGAGSGKQDAGGSVPCTDRKRV